MKKHFLLIAIGLISLTTYAQMPITAGVQGQVSGFQLSKPSRDYLTSFRPGFALGAFARFDLNKTFYFQPELTFGYIDGNIEPDNKLDQPVKTAAVAVPLLIGAKLVQMPDVNFRVYLGLGNTITVLNNIRAFNDQFSKVIQNYDSGIEASPYQVSGIIGIGFDLMDVTVDLRYGRDFNQTITLKNSDNKKDKFYQNAFTLAIGFKMIKS